MADEGNVLIPDEDNEQWRELFVTYTPRLWRLFLRKGILATQAEELVQKTWLRVLETWDRIDPERPIEPLIFKTALHIWQEWQKSDPGSSVPDDSDTDEP